MPRIFRTDPHEKQDCRCACLSSQRSPVSVGRQQDNGRGTRWACGIFHTIRWTKLAGRGSTASMHLRGRRPRGAWQHYASGSRYDNRTTRNTGRGRRPKSSAGSRAFRPVLSTLAAGIWLALSTTPAIAMRIPQPWNEEPACAMVRDPEWPFVYSKYRTQEVCTRVGLHEKYFKKLFTATSCVFLSVHKGKEGNECFGVGNLIIPRYRTREKAGHTT